MKNFSILLLLYALFIFSCKEKNTFNLKMAYYDSSNLYYDSAIKYFNLSNIYYDSAKKYLIANTLGKSEPFIKMRTVMIDSFDFYAKKRSDYVTKYLNTNP